MSYYIEFDRGSYGREVLDKIATNLEKIAKELHTLNEERTPKHNTSHL